jgi:hypothetical protein
MAFKKRDVIAEAFEEIGLGSYVFDLLPEQWQSALRKLDTMMAGWNAKGIRIGYPLPSSFAASDLDQDMDITDIALEAMRLNLAVRLAPGYGKTVSPDTRSMAATSYRTILSFASQPPTRQLDNRIVPAGAGHKRHGGRYNVFLDPPEDRLKAGPDSYVET